MNKSNLFSCLWMVVAVAAMFAVANTASADLLRYYAMNETSGTTMVDSTGNQNGTYHDSPNLAEPSANATLSGTAVGFNDVSYATIGNLGQALGYDVSLAAWIAPTNPELECIVGGSNTQQWDLNITSTGKLEWEFGKSTTPVTYDTTNAVTSFDGTWTHVGITYDHNADQLKMYENEALIQTISTAGVGISNISVGVPYYVGGASQLGFTGGIDEVHAWNDVEPLSTFQNLSKLSTPEPSALVLTTMGLIGLLAYAWRKRK